MRKLLFSLTGALGLAFSTSAAFAADRDPLDELVVSIAKRPIILVKGLVTKPADCAYKSACWADSDKDGNLKPTPQALIFGTAGAMSGVVYAVENAVVGKED